MTHPDVTQTEPLDAPDWVERYVVEVNYDGWRLDQFLTQKLRRASRSHVVRILANGARMADGRAARPSLRVRTGDIVELPRHERADPATPGLEAVVVLHEEADLVVLGKPAGMLVHRTAHEATRTVEAWLRLRYPAERAEAGHRLDRDTEGCLVCARGDDAVRHLRALFAGGGVEKHYRARVYDPGCRWTPGQRATLATPLGFDPSSEVALRMGRGALACATHVTTLERDDDHALLDVSIEGGRQHQIRAHLSLEGTPIVGDKLYGMGDAFFLAWRQDPADEALERTLPRRWHALAAHRVVFPWRGGTRSVQAQLAADLRTRLERQAGTHAAAASADASDPATGRGRGPA